MRIFEHTNIDFLRWRWHAIGLSLVVILAGVGTIVSRGGLPLGIDFTGGTAMTFRFQQAIAEDAVRQALVPIAGEKIVQRVRGGASDNDIMVRLPVAPEEQGTSIEQPSVQAEQAVRAANLGAFTVENREVVGPIIGADLARKGIYATLTALAGILIYIGVRFNFTFAMGAIVAVFHDILITLVFLTWFGYDLSLNVIAAILTITGYSVNDTIVIFDRVRENQRLLRRESLTTLINASVNQTLSRTIITSGTTFLTVLSLFLFGGEVLRSFSFTMLVGILTGTYSTVFIAAAIAIIVGGRRRGSATAPATDTRTRTEAAVPGSAARNKRARV